MNNVATGLDTLEYSTKNIFYQKKKKVIRIKKVIYSIKICFFHPHQKKKKKKKKPNLMIPEFL